ncbi:transposase [Patescibacteria group bacterium]|nr:transposase [Patescibacteria group bacterium]
MPSRNILKTYIRGGHYHIYNRGINKRKIFLDEQDYCVFLNYLKIALSPPPKLKDIKEFTTVQGSSFQKVPRLPKNFDQEIELLCYCLMPNHFHLLIKQDSRDSMQGFMRSIATRYSMYFNKKYERMGKLFQGIYKAIPVQKDEYLLHLSRYIHLNPAEHTNKLADDYSSYANYLKLKSTPWVRSEKILAFFSQGKLPFMKKINTYKDFVEKYQTDSKNLLGDIALE